MEYRAFITAAYIRSILDYNPNTGIFTWRYRPDMPKKWNTRWAGKVAGGTMLKGRKHICINYVQYLTNRLAWLYMTGEWPSVQVDHEDNDPSNDAWQNLRLATHGQNKMNSKIMDNNKTGLKGVSMDKRGKYIARIAIDKKQIWLGYFDCPAVASFAYQIAADKYHGEFARVA